MRTTSWIRRGLVAVPLFVVAPLVVQGCSAESTGVGTSAQGCPEIASTTIDESAAIDAKVKVFMQASVDLREVAKKVKGDVRNACASMAMDLGAQDTWSAKGDVDASISNAEGTGACDVAAAKIDAIMKTAVAANLTLVTVPGVCHTDFQAETACDTKCKTEEHCDPGTVETRCTPGELSVKCDDKCKVNGWCEGNANVAANCMGQCESTCQGQCQGTCTKADGTRTENDPNCNGKCSSTCNGVCRGKCKVTADAGVACGADVRCKGECTTTHTDPICETVYGPPTCKVDTSCHESCSASVAAKAVCEPPHVELFAIASVNADVPKLVLTINKNLPALLSAAEAQGKLALDVVGKLVVTGKAIAQSTTTLDGKSITCGAAAVKTAAEASASLSVSVSASANVTGKCRGNAG